MADPDATLGNGWRTSADRAVASAADNDGVHVLVADSKDAYAWRTAAVLAEPGMPADTWIGNSCVIDTGHAAMVYAPRTFTNHQDLMLGGAFAAVVDLDTGAVTKLPFTASLAYFDPTCNPATGTAAFTAYRDEKTRLVTVDTAGRTVADTTAGGQVTSAVPVADGTVAALGNRLVHIGRTGRTTTLAATDSTPYDIHPQGGGSHGKAAYAFLDHKGDTTAHARLWTAGKITTVAAGPLTDLGLQQSGTGKVFLTGHPTGTVRTAGTGITKVTAGIDTQLSSLGRFAVDPVVAPAVQSGLANIAGAGRAAAVVKPQSSPAPAPAQTSAGTADDGTLTLTATATTTGRKVTQTVAAAAVPSTTASPALTGSPTATTQTARRSTSANSKPAAATVDHNPVDTDRYCSVPRNDTAAQALQPTPNQVEWAVDMAVRGDLTSGWITQGGWRSQTGLGTIDPQGLFAKPALTGGGNIPAQVELGILAQESNLWQAESGAIPGQMGNPLASVAGFYGHTGTAPSDYWKIDWENSDCGYGVGQVTDGMRLAGHEKPGETALSPTLQKAVALDYTVNIAASLQILADKWNEVHSADSPITVNNDDPSKPENWFTAVWNYNLGFNPPGSGPGGPDGPWGLGWYNNPANPIYPASRLAFMDTSLDPNANHDAAHPQDWPYEEKVMGWAAWSIDTGHSYATSGRQDWPGESGFSSAGFQPSWWLTTGDRSQIKPPLDAFCNSSNDCDISNPPPCETDHIEGCDQLHWWNQPNTVWKPDCADTCGHESIKYQTLRAEPGRGYRLQYGTPDCAAPPTGAIVVHSVPDGTPTWSDCGNTTSAGTFQFTFYPDSDGQYEAKGDLHQIGGGYQGHYWYAHTRDTAYLGGDGGRMTVLGDWKMNAPVSQKEAKVYVHVPDTGAQATDADYQIVTPFGTVDKTISQSANSANAWVSLGAYRFNDQPPEVRLSNTTGNGTGDTDIAWDAVAFVPGDYGGVPGITFPNPDDSAPLPGYEGPARPVQRGGLPAMTPAARAALTAHEGGVAPIRLTPAQLPKPGVGAHCSTADAQGRSTCITVGRPDSAEARSMDKAIQNRPLDGIPIPSWCPGSQLTDTETRTQACLNGFSPVNIQFSVNDKIVGYAKFAMMQNIQLFNNTAEIDQSLIIVPFEIDPELGAVSLSWVTASDCDDCTQSPKVTTGEMAWTGSEDLHVAAQTFQTFWNGTGEEDVGLGWILAGAVEAADVTTPISLGNTYGDLDIRCDDMTKGNSSPGCVFKNYTPTYTVSTDRYPAAGAYYWLMRTHNSHHFGSTA
ncbi:golvesin C-terminal-like domain-containing protein, partial [Actinacidiphila guanduensis]|uniref:golvesin C-terminal-like domain-containing protein n=1 Tax=Actinacidiphila guanduensis TaxID=310781 RepID=UPI000B83A0BF